ncbi:MAG: PASTA domain-containing protein, partial [Candidatus Adiutrix sp.]
PIAMNQHTTSRAQSEFVSPPLPLSDLDFGLASVPGVMPNLSGLSMGKVLEVMSSHEMDLEYVGSGYVIGQNPPPGSQAAPGQMGSIYFEQR